jgi:uncharacterized phosphosugar-binding protein
VYTRAGTLTNSKPISLDNYLGKLERIDGVGQALMGSFTGLPGEVLIVVSTSGANPLPIDVALIGKQRGLFTAAITAMDHTLKVKSNHKSGKKLYEIVDLVIDTHALLRSVALTPVEKFVMDNSLLGGGEMYICLRQKLWILGCQ